MLHLNGVDPVAAMTLAGCIAPNDLEPHTSTLILHLITSNDETVRTLANTPLDKLQQVSDRLHAAAAHGSSTYLSRCRHMR